MTATKLGDQLMKQKKHYDSQSLEWNKQMEEMATKLQEASSDARQCFFLILAKSTSLFLENIDF